MTKKTIAFLGLRGLEFSVPAKLLISSAVRDLYSKIGLDLQLV